MITKAFQFKLIRLGGIGLQIIAGIYLVLLLIVLVVIPLPEKGTHEEFAQKYEDLVSSIDIYDGLIWIGVFFLGRWMQKTWKLKSNRGAEAGNGSGESNL